jgi:hypothetical protein
VSKLEEIRDVYNKRRSEQSEIDANGFRNRALPEMVLRCTFNANSDVVYDAGFPLDRVALDSNLTLERANLARETGVRVVWFDPLNCDKYELVDSIIGELT